MGNPWYVGRTWLASSFLWHASEDDPYIFFIGHLRTCGPVYFCLEVGTAALLSSAATSAAVFFYQQRKAAAPLLLRRSSDQRSSASVKITDLPLPLLQNKKILKTVHYAAI